MRRTAENRADDAGDCGIDCQAVAASYMAVWQSCCTENPKMLMLKSTLSRNLRLIADLIAYSLYRMQPAPLPCINTVMILAASTQQT
jgi:hypothetical protein